MNYASYRGYEVSKANSGIRQDPTNPAQLGYSINKPLDRVKRQTLGNAININALNYPEANLLTHPANSLGTLQTFGNQASQFASDLYTESKTFLTDTTVGTIPNYWLVGGALALLLAFKGGKHRGKR